MVIKTSNPGKTDKSSKAPKSTFSKKLASLRETWSSASAEAKDFKGGDDMPVGSHVCRLTDAKLMEVGDDSTLKLLTVFTCVAGDNAGTTVARWDNMEREDSQKWIAIHLIALGVDPDEVSDSSNIEQICKDLIAARPGCRVRVTTNAGGYTNSRVLKLIDDADMPEEEVADSAQDVVNNTEIEKGDEVTWGSGKKAMSGTVIKIVDDTATVKDDEGNRHTVDLEDLTTTGGDPVDADPLVPKKGMMVSFEADGETVTGKITSCPPNAKKVMVETDDAEISVDVKDLREAEVEQEPADPETAEFEKGDKVSFTHEKKTVVGKVLSVNEKKETLKVSAKGVTYELALDECEKLATGE